MINVGADCFFASEITAKNNADAVKERTPKREILIPENFLSGRQEKHFCDCPVIAAGNFRLSY